MTVGTQYLVLPTITTAIAIYEQQPGIAIRVGIILREVLNARCHVAM